MEFLSKEIGSLPHDDFARQFLNACSDIAGDGLWNGYRIRNEVICPYHSYVVEAITLLDLKERTTSLSEVRAIRDELELLGESFTNGEGISEHFAVPLWDLGLAVGHLADTSLMTSFSLPCGSHDVEKWVRRIPIYFELSSHDQTETYNIADANWHQENHGDRWQDVLHILRSAVLTFQHLGSWFIETGMLDHDFANSTETLERMRKLEQTLLFRWGDKLLDTDNSTPDESEKPEAIEPKKMSPKQIEDSAMSVARDAFKSGRRFSGITEFAHAVGCTHTGKTIAVEWERVRETLAAEPYPQAAAVSADAIGEETRTLDDLAKEQQHADDDTKPTPRHTRKPRRV